MKSFQRLSPISVLPGLDHASADVGNSFVTHRRLIARAQTSKGAGSGPLTPQLLGSGLGGNQRSQAKCLFPQKTPLTALSETRGEAEPGCAAARWLCPAGSPRCPHAWIHTGNLNDAGANPDCFGCWTLLSVHMTPGQLPSTEALHQKTPLG